MMSQGLNIKAEVSNDSTPKKMRKSSKNIETKKDETPKENKKADKKDRKPKRNIKKQITIDDVPYVDANKAAEIIGTAKATVYSYIRHGKLAVTKNNSKSYIKLSDVEKFAKQLEDKRIKNAKPVEISQYALWKRHIHSLCKQIGGEEGKILSAAYKHLTNVYGVVYAQLKKDFYKANDRSSSGTLELIYWLESNDRHYKNLLENYLEDAIANGGLDK